MQHSKMTLTKMTLTKMTLSLMTSSIKTIRITTQHSDIQDNNKKCDAQYNIVLNIAMLIVLMLSVAILMVTK
jgi:hypothetical protein